MYIWNLYNIERQGSRINLRYLANHYSNQRRTRRAAQLDLAPAWLGVASGAKQIKNLLSAPLTPLNTSHFFTLCSAFPFSWWRTPPQTLRRISCGHVSHELHWYRAALLTLSAALSRSKRARGRERERWTVRVASAKGCFGACPSDGFIRVQRSQPTPGRPRRKSSVESESDDPYAYVGP